MTDRRRNLARPAARRAPARRLARRHRDEADAPRPGPEGRRRARLPGEAHEVLEGHRRRRRAHDRHHAQARRRARRRGAGDPALGRRPDRRRRCRTSRTPTRPQQQVGTTAQLFFYDWEKNVLGPDCKPAPTNFAVTGGPSAGSAGVALSQYDARRRARAVPADHRAASTSATAAKLLPRRHARPRRSSPGRRRSRPTSRGVGRATPDGPIQVWQVNPGTVDRPGRVADTRRAATSSRKKGPDAYYVLRDDFALRGTDIKNPEQNFDQKHPGAERHVRLHELGAQEVAEDHAARSPSAARTSSPRPTARWSPTPAEVPALRDRAGQPAHLGPVHRLPAEPGRHRRRQRARRSRAASRSQSAQALANQLKYGALPVKLELISQSQVSATLGKQALHQGLIAGIVGFAIVALFLLIFYRILGVIAVGALIVYAIYLFALIKLIPITLTLAGHRGPDPHASASRPTRTS